MSDKYFDRTGFTGDSVELIADISNAFDLGEVVSSSVLAVGFEDCNVKVETEEGKFAVKAFGSFRDGQNMERYIDVMKTAIQGRVNHPQLRTTSSNEVLFHHPSGVSAIVMDFIEGQTYFDSKTIPNDKELGLVTAEAVKIHALDLDPPRAEDSWAIPNIHTMYKLTAEFLDDEGRRLAEQAMARYDNIDLSRLTKCFVHGDITSANTLKDSKGKIWILDFSVSNTFPKIQELAVIAANLLADSKSYVSLRQRVDKVLSAYLAAGGTLSKYDKEALLDYTIAGSAMEFMGGHKVKYIDANSDPEECDYWIAMGRQALEEVL